MALKFAVGNGAVVTKDGRTIVITKGQVWQSGDEVVKARPEIFADEPEYVHSTTKSGKIETATAAPGEKRSTSRRKSED